MLNTIFSWMPAPILALTMAAFGVFALVVVAKIFRLILSLIPFL